MEGRETGRKENLREKEKEGREKKGKGEKQGRGEGKEVAERRREGRKEECSLTW